MSTLIATNGIVPAVTGLILSMFGLPLFAGLVLLLATAVGLL